MTFGGFRRRRSLARLGQPHGHPTRNPSVVLSRPRVLLQALNRQSYRVRVFSRVRFVRPFTRPYPRPQAEGRWSAAHWSGDPSLGPLAGVWSGSYAKPPYVVRALFQVRTRQALRPRFFSRVILLRPQRPAAAVA